MKKNILIIDKDNKIAEELKCNVYCEEYDLLTVGDISKALSILPNNNINLVIFNFDANSSKEIDVINYIKVNIVGCDVVVLTDMKDIELATRAVRHGAFLYLVKPVDPEDLKIVMEKIFIKQEKDAKYLESQTQLMRDLVGGNEKMDRAIVMADKVATTDSTVLISGESGTGKEVFARYIHMKSKRADGPFIAVNCGALPENLMESELFGHVKGAFTGASYQKKGLIEAANQGTLFLDEVGELSQQAQVKLLRFLQDHTVRMVGGSEERIVDVRIIGATNKDLIKETMNGNFREDLFYRLNVIHIHLPPLRQRQENISKLIPFFIIKYATNFDKKPPSVEPNAMGLLKSYSYPGNIRELENIIERAVLLSESNIVEAKDLPDHIRVNRPLISSRSNEIEEEIVSLSELEKRHIVKALKKLENNQSEVAKKLGLSRTTLWRKIKEYEIDV